MDKSNVPFMVDFETASVKRKPSNVTSICQFLFISGLVAKTVAEKLGRKDQKTIVEALKRYKSNRTHKNLKDVLQACDFR
jgi:putative serine/threonine protein kinase